MPHPLESHLVAEATRSYTPITANFELTPLCNFRCDMCRVRLTHEEMEALGGLRDAASWLHIARQLRDMGTLFILLTGGEPLLHPDFHTIYTSLCDMGFVVMVNTNGTLITEELCTTTFHHHPRRVSVTLYGSSSDTYARVCHNAEGYDRAMNGLRLLHSHGIATKINLSMVSPNADDYEELLSIAADFKMPTITDTYMFPTNRHCDVGSNAFSRLSSHDAAYIDTLSLRHEKGAKFIDYARNLVEQALHPSSSGNVTCLDCRAGRSSLWVKWDHRITPCSMMETPCVVLPSGSTHPFRLPEGIPFAESEIENPPEGHTAQELLPPYDLAAAWEWLAYACATLPQLSTCDGCNLLHLCKKCYAALVSEHTHYGNHRYLCETATLYYKMLKSHA